MSRVENEVLFSQMNWRYACKKFDPNKIIREADWNILAETLRLTPSSNGLQPWKFILVQQNTELRQKLYEAAWKQSAVIDSSHFLVITYKEKIDEAYIERHIENTSLITGNPIENLAKYRNSIIRDIIQGPRGATVEWWAQRQCYIAMGSLLTTAALMEIDTLPMEGINCAAYDQLLEIEGSGYKTIAAIACGYRSPEDKYASVKKVRFDMKDVLTIK